MVHFSLSFETTLQSPGVATSILTYFLFDYNTIQFSCLHFMVMLYVEVLKLALSVSITLLRWCLHYFSALFSPYTPFSSHWNVLVHCYAACWILSTQAHWWVKLLPLMLHILHEGNPPNLVQGAFQLIGPQSLLMEHKMKSARFLVILH